MIKYCMVFFIIIFFLFLSVSESSEQRLIRISINPTPLDASVTIFLNDHILFSNNDIKGVKEYDILVRNGDIIKVITEANGRIPKTNTIIIEKSMDTIELSPQLKLERRKKPIDIAFYNIYKRLYYIAKRPKIEKLTYDVDGINKLLFNISLYNKFEVELPPEMKKNLQDAENIYNYEIYPIQQDIVNGKYIGQNKTRKLRKDIDHAIELLKDIDDELNSHFAAIKIIQFDTDQYKFSTLNQFERDKLDYIIMIINREQSCNLLIQGHADERKDINYNKNLSDKRCAAVVKYIMKRVNKGIELDCKVGKNCKVSSHGETKPVDERRNPDGWKINRRVEIAVERIND